MEKKFTMKEDYLEVVVTNTDKIWLPMEDGTKEFIGSFEQTTIQKIDKDKAEVLRNFIQREYNKGNQQLELIQKNLDTLKDVQEIDDEVVQAVKKQIGKGTKEFKQKMLVLNNHIENVIRKKNNQAQFNHMAVEVERIKTELDAINEAIQ
jgi:hypothetical protein